MFQIPKRFICHHYSNLQTYFKIVQHLLLAASLLIALATTLVSPPAALADATIMVTSALDDTLASLDGNGTCDLREAIQAANTDLTVGECFHNSSPGVDTINFAGDYTILLSGSGNEDDNDTDDLDILAGDLVIDGGGQNIVVDGGGDTRVFDVNPPIAPETSRVGTQSFSVTISGLLIQNGLMINDEGGGVRSNSVDLTVADSTVSNNLALRGGGIFFSGGSLILTSVNIGDAVNGGNESSEDGGGLYVDFMGAATITSSTFYDNQAQTLGGGGIANYGDNLSISSSSFISNTALGEYGGGGIYAPAGAVIITGSNFIGNSAYEGGGISNLHEIGTTLEIRNSTFSANQATGEFGGGGAISSYWPLLIEGSTFTGNTANSEIVGGGGLFHMFAEATIANSTFSGNSALGSGGGIFVGNTITITYVTIAGNTADQNNSGNGDGGGIYFFGESGPAVGNTIIAGNLDLSGGGSDCFTDVQSAPMNSLDYNLIEDTTGCNIFGATDNNIEDLDPLLGPLQDNGGPTHTRALLEDSPAIDTANPLVCLATDQRGVTRPQPDGGLCDIGAFEREPVIKIPDIYLPVVLNPGISKYDLSVGFEDLPLNEGNDFDYNDWVVTIDTDLSYNSLEGETIELTRVAFLFTPKARGASLDHEFQLRFQPDTFASDGDSTLIIRDSLGDILSNTLAPFTSTQLNQYTIFPSTSAVLPPPGTSVNTVEGVGPDQALMTAELTITFDEPFLFTLSDFGPHGEGLFFEPYLSVHASGGAYDIGTSDVRTLIVPEIDWKWPEERIRIDNAYPGITYSGPPEMFVFPSGWWATHNVCVYGDDVVCPVPNPLEWLKDLGVDPLHQ